MLKQFYLKKTQLSISKQFSFIQNSSISNSSVWHKYAVSISKTVLLQTIQFSISTHFSSIRPIAIRPEYFACSVDILKRFRKRW